MTVPYAVVNNRLASRFEIDLEGELAVLTYAETGAAIDLLHTEVAPTLEGRGVGSALAAAALAYAAHAGKRVIATCPFVRGYMQRHPDWNAATHGRDDF